MVKVIRTKLTPFFRSYPLAIFESWKLFYALTLVLPSYSTRRATNTSYKRPCDMKK